MASKSVANLRNDENLVTAGNKNGENQKKLTNVNNVQKRKALAPIGVKPCINSKPLANVNGKRQAINAVNKNVKPVEKAPLVQKTNVEKDNGDKQKFSKFNTKSRSNVLDNNQGKQKAFTIYCDEKDEKVEKCKSDDVTVAEVKSFDQVVDKENRENKSNLEKPIENKENEKAKENVEKTDSKCEIMAIDELTINEKSFQMDDEKEEKIAEQSEAKDESMFEQSDESMIDLTMANVSFDQMLIYNCIEYSEEIHLYLLDIETKLRPDPLYMPKQQEINGKMRCILVDWMIEVADEYKLSDETLFLAVNFIDRFLSCMSISRASFQLLGTAALFIASKYEEIYPPDVNEFVYITAETYTIHQVLSMEKLVLKVLQFDLSSPTSSYFLRKYITYLHFGRNVECMAQYYCFMTLLDEAFTRFTASEIAIASIIMASYAFDLTNIKLDFYLNTLIIYYLNQEKKDVLIRKKITIIQECVSLLYEMKKCSDSKQAIAQKFSTADFSNVANVVQKDSIPLVRSYF